MKGNAIPLSKDKSTNPMSANPNMQKDWQTEGAFWLVSIQIGYFGCSQNTSLAISQGTYSSHICSIIHIYIWIQPTMHCFQAYIGQSTIATFPVTQSLFLSPASFWNCIITDSTDIGFRTEQMVLIGMRSLRLDSDWLTWAWAKNNLWFFYTCVCALEIEESERKTEGEGEKGRAQRRRGKLFISCFAPPALPHLSLSLRNSGL